MKSLLKPQILYNVFERAYKKQSNIPELTRVRHNIQRGAYSLLKDKDIAFFESTVTSKNIFQGELLDYNVDFFRSVRGESRLMLKPTSVQEISAILRYCNERRLAVCPQGGNTGVVGGCVPVFDEIILSLEKLNRIIKVDEYTSTAICESGCILENLDNRAREVGLIVPIDLGAKSSCHIGGNISTNAGGLRVLRYGNLHGSVLGVEVVLANGEVLDLMSALKKDNTGYHLKHLFIGSEGTLGVVTKVSIHCAPLPQSVNVAFMGLSTFDDVLKTFLNAKRNLGEILSACEMIDAPGLEYCVKKYNLNSPIEPYPFYMLIETSGSDASHDLEKLNNFLETGMQRAEILDGVVCGEPSKMREIWKLRELVPLALMKDGYCFVYDISLPLREFYDIVPIMQKRVGHLATCVSGFGHLGDSNLHLNVACSKFTDELYRAIEPFIYEYTASVKGSVSAEHGIGFLKTDYLKYSKNASSIQMMRDIKALFDPNGILNPYKVLQ